MSEWKEYYLDELGTLARGKSKHRPRWAPHLYGGDYPFIQTGQITAAHKYITTVEQTYSEEGLLQSKLWNEGTLCITIAANIAEIAILSFPACFPDSVLGFQVDKNKADLDFVFYMLTQFQHRLKSLAIGSVQDNINLGTFKNIQFPFPGLHEQKEIGRTLSLLDKKISLLRQQNQDLEELAQTLFKRWFVEESDPTWDCVVISDVANVFIGRTPPRKEEEWFSRNEKDVKWVSIKDLGENGVYVSQTSEYLTQEAVDKFSIPIIEPNTVLLSFKMTLGRVGITTEKMLSNEAIAQFRIKEDSNLSPEFLYFFLKTFKYQNLGSTSSIVTSINSGMIKDIPMVLPDKNTLIKFSNSVKPLFNKMKSNTNEIQILTQLRDTLLPKLMSGQLKF